MTGIIVALAADRRTGMIRTQDGSRLSFSATAVLGDFDALSVGHPVNFDIERGRSRHTAVRVFREPACAGAPGKRPHDPPDLRYTGFQQAANIRTYRFDTVAEAAAQPVRHGVTVDMALLAKYHIGMQEAPALCLRKLTSDLKTAPDCGCHQLSDDDLLAFVSSRATPPRRRPKHVFAGRRGPSPPGPSPSRRTP